LGLDRAARDAHQAPLSRIGFAFLINDRSTSGASASQTQVVIVSSRVSRFSTPETDFGLRKGGFLAHLRSPPADQLGGSFFISASEQSTGVSPDLG
jgi:hypothetical protein